MKLFVKLLITYVFLISRAYGQEAFSNSSVVGSYGILVPYSETMFSSADSYIYMHDEDSGTVGSNGQARYDTVLDISIGGRTLSLTSRGFLGDGFLSMFFPGTITNNANSLFSNNRLNVEGFSTPVRDYFGMFQDEMLPNNDALNGLQWILFDNSDKAGSRISDLIEIVWFRKPYSATFVFCDVGLVSGADAGNLFSNVDGRCEAFQRFGEVNDIITSKSTVEIFEMFKDPRELVMIVGDVSFIGGEFVVTSVVLPRVTTYAGAQFRGWGNFLQQSQNAGNGNQTGATCIFSPEEFSKYANVKTGTVIHFRPSLREISSGSIMLDCQAI